jgi:phosphoribosylaminoimidazole (AIR) synthetase
MKVNKAYTPRNMMRAAAHITGKPCPNLPSVVDNLTTWVEEHRNGS